MIPEVTPAALAAELKGECPPKLLDVREAEELQISRLPVDYHIPMGELPFRLAELDRNENLVVVCRSGARSGQVTAFLLAQGFEHVRNLTTGLNGWSRSVDPSMRQY